MIDLLSLLMQNPGMTQQQMAQDGSYRTPELRPEDVLMQELAKNGGASGERSSTIYSSPINMANVSSAASLTPILLHLLMMGLGQPAYGGGVPGGMMGGGMPGMGAGMMGMQQQQPVQGY